MFGCQMLPLRGVGEGGGMESGRGTQRQRPAKGLGGPATFAVTSRQPLEHDLWRSLG